MVPFLASRSLEEARGLLGDLLELRLKPLIRGIIRRRLRLVPGAGEQMQDTEDLVAEAAVKLIERLQALRDERLLETIPAGRLQTTGPAINGISNLAGYAATVAYSVCDDFLRRKYPRRRRLKNRVQYLLTHRREFGLWKVEGGETYGGFDTWRTHGSKGGSGARIRDLEEHTEEFENAELGGRPARQESPEGLVSAIFRWAGGPVEIDTLVSLLGRLWDIREEEVHSEAEEDALGRDAASSLRRPDASERLERRAFLARLWLEICQLPPRQRSAVLLNLRDGAGCSAVELFPLLGVASIRQIAETVGTPVAEFAALWNRLPLDDALIAARLRVTRQQVINLRKSARERLARRLRDRYG
ncbi:MAG: hypothetical protein ABIG68_06705 [Acidobacteriota bacterium]